MKLKFFIVTFVVAVISAQESSSLKSFIVGGSDAEIEDYPYMAGVLNFGLPSCGGAIINSRSVLTAAHCFLINSAASISVFAGSSGRRGQGGRTYRALRLIIHPEYLYTEDLESFQMKNDVAVIRTLTRIQFSNLVQPINLGANFVSPGTQVVLAGWGLTGNVGLLFCDDHKSLVKIILSHSQRYKIVLNNYNDWT